MAHGAHCISLHQLGVYLVDPKPISVTHVVINVCMKNIYKVIYDLSVYLVTLDYL